MATQSKVSNRSQVYQGRIVKPNINMSMVVFAILIVVLATGWIMAMAPAVNHESNGQRVLLAESARYNGLAKIYLGMDAVNRQQAINAETARYAGLAEFYLAKNETNSQRAIDANIARYNGLAELYLTKVAVNRQRALDADAARYTGLAELFTSSK